MMFPATMGLSTISSWLTLKSQSTSPVLASKPKIVPFLLPTSTVLPATVGAVEISTLNLVDHLLFPVMASRAKTLPCSVAP